MHVLFVHKEYPGHFGHVAARLARDEGFACTFVYNKLPARFFANLIQQESGFKPHVVSSAGAKLFSRPPG